MSKIVPEEKARQGRWGRPVLVVLIAGLLLAVVIWGLVEIYGKSIEPEREEIVGQASNMELVLKT